MMQENFVSLLESNANRLGDRVALLWEGGSLSWSELDRRASGFALRLARQGVTPGDRVAMSLPNHWRFAVAFLGILKLGGTVATLNPTLKAEETAAILSDLRPKLVVDDVPAREGVWKTRPLTDSPALIVYTSGSTGRPKGAVFSHEALIFGVKAWGISVLGLKEGDVVLGALPFAHNYGMYSGLLAPLLFGAKSVMVEHFSAEAVFEAIARHRVTVFPGVATMFRRLLNSPAFPDADLSSLRLAVAGAAPCPWELCQEWRERTGARILRGYGMTEVPRPISYFCDDPYDSPDAIGRPVPGAEALVVDEAGRPLSSGEVGELWIKCPAATDGYLEAPEESAAVLTDGWVKTGDLATISPQGYIRIAGRKRERILRGGFSVFPHEVEAALLCHPAVAEAAVVGIPHLDLGEEIAAFVTLRPTAAATAEELISFCKAHLAHYKFPRRLTILEEIPKGETGKVLKSELMKAQV